jgi:predicted RNase H-like nuclease (RuvC/YqgF family)
MNEQSWYSEKDTNRVIDSLLDKQEILHGKLSNNNTKIEDLKKELKDLNFVLTTMMFLNTVFLLIIAFS